MKITTLGSIALFIYTQKRAKEVTGMTITATQIGEVLALTPSDITSWKQGKRKLRGVIHFTLLSSLLETSIESLLDIATERDTSQLDVFSLDLARIRTRRFRKGA